MAGSAESKNNSTYVLMKMDEYESVRGILDAKASAATSPESPAAVPAPDPAPVIPAASWRSRSLARLGARPPSSWAQILLAAAVVAGLSGLYLQLRAYRNADERESQRRNGEALSRVYAIEIDIRKFLCNYPEIREYLSDDPNGKKFKQLEHGSTEESQKLLVRIKLVCGMYCNFFEYYLLVEHDLSDGMKDQVQTAYRNYIRMIGRQSYALRSHLLGAPDTWTDTLVQIILSAESAPAD
jgi:hypothetical protein